MVTKAVIDTLIAEAGGEGEVGLIAAAWAVQQRAAARGQTIDQVVRSGFDGYTNPGSGAVKAQQNPALRAKVEQIMRGVQDGSIPNPVPGADHFLSGDVMPGWAKSMRLVATIGGHRFYASGKVPEEAQGGSVLTELDVTPPRVAPRPADLTPAVTAARNRVTPQTPSPAINAARTPAVTGRSIGDSLALDPVRGVELPRVTAFTAPNGQIMSMPEFAKNSVPGRLVGEDAVKAGKVIEPSGVMRVGGPSVIAGTVQLPAGVRPNVTIPEMPPAPTAKIDVVGKMPAFGDVAMLARQNVPAANTASKNEERLVAQAVGLTPRAGTVQPTKDQVEAGTGFRLGGEKSALTTTEVEVANPAYARLQERVRQGELEMRGISPSGMPMSRDGRARYEASLAAIQRMRDELAGTSPTIRVQRTARAPQAQPAPQRAAAPAMTAVQRLQAQGLSAAQAYAAANAQGAQQARANATRGTKSDLQDRIVRDDLWGAHSGGSSASSLVG